MIDNQLRQHLDILNHSRFATKKLKKSQSWLAHKINGTDSQKGFTLSEYKVLSDALRAVILDLEKGVQYCDTKNPAYKHGFLK